MSNSTSTASNASELKQLVLELILPSVSLMSPGDISDAEGLFPPECWESLSGPDHRSIGTVISKLVAQKKLPLEPSGFTSSRHNLYRKI